jgi:hypothetical protein
MKSLREDARHDTVSNPFFCAAGHKEHVLFDVESVRDIYLSFMTNKR